MSNVSKVFSKCFEVGFNILNYLKSVILTLRKKHIIYFINMQFAYTPYRVKQHAPSATYVSIII